MKDRLSKIMAEKNVSASILAKLLDIQPSTISHVLSGRNNPNLTFIQKLLNAFPDINAKWLISGDDNMFSKTESNPDKKELIIPEPQITHDNEIANNSQKQLTEKKIEKVIIFYNDRSFVEYRPE